MTPDYSKLPPAHRLQFPNCIGRHKHGEGSGKCPAGVPTSSSDQELNRAKQEVGLVGHNGRVDQVKTGPKKKAVEGEKITTIGMDEEKKAE